MINNKYFKNEVFNNNSVIEIPKDWEVKKTGVLLNGVVGTTPPKKDPNNFIGNLEWINISDMGSYLINSEKTVNRNAKGVKNRIIEKNSLLYSFKLSVGEIGFNKNEAMTNEAIISFSPSKNKNVNLKYFYYVLKKYLHLNAGANVYGAPIMNQEKIKDADLIVTEDISEQNKIVEILDKQQSLINSYKEKLSLLEEQESYYQDELLSGRIRIKLNSENEKVAIDKGFIVNGELVEGKDKEFEEWLSVDFKDKVEFYKEKNFDLVEFNEKKKEIPKNWSFTKIKNLKGVIIQNGFAFKKQDMLSNSESFLIKIGNIQDNKIILKDDNQMIKSADEKYKLKKGDVVIGLSGANAGKMGIFDLEDNCYLNQRNVFIRIENNDFLINSFEYNVKVPILKFVRNMAIPNISSNDILNIDIAYPKNKIESILINKLINNFPKFKKDIKEKIKMEEEKMDYLMDELLSGRIKVE